MELKPHPDLDIKGGPLHLTIGSQDQNRIVQSGNLPRASTAALVEWVGKQWKVEKTNVPGDDYLPDKIPDLYAEVISVKDTNKAKIHITYDLFLLLNLSLPGLDNVVLDQVHFSYRTEHSRLDLSGALVVTIPDQNDGEERSVRFEGGIARDKNGWRLGGQWSVEGEPRNPGVTVADLSRALAVG
ncbi:hypothetical protein [Streptomyces sp. enrichment culture]|uniref:hypothetical protein n=1 Tax=Streptomyces sp. enrichment culture TaxID=1795815 RepID=UPI003F5603B5